MTSWGGMWWARSTRRQSGLISRITPFIAPIYPSASPKSVNRVMIGLSAIRPPEPYQGLFKRRSDYPVFRDDGAYITVRGDVEGGVADSHPFRSSAPPPKGCYLRGIAFFNGDLFPCFYGQIEGRKGRGHIEGYLMLAGEDGQGVGPDLVGHIPVAGDPVCPDDTEIDLSLPHERTCHMVGDKGDGDPF